VARDKETFLSRWSRRKLEEANAPAAPAPAKPDAAPPPDLPPVDRLGFDSDYRGFLHPKVDEALRRQALKKLFGSAHFQTPDMMDDFNEDYTTLLEPLAPGAADKLAHAKRTLLGSEHEPPAEGPREAAAETTPAALAQAEDAASPAPEEQARAPEKDAGTPEEDDGARG